MDIYKISSSAGFESASGSCGLCTGMRGVWSASGKSVGRSAATGT